MGEMSLTSPLVVLTVGVKQTDTSLGNTIYQIASTVALATEFGVPCGFPEMRRLCSELEEIGYDHQKKIYRNVPTGDVGGDEGVDVLRVQEKCADVYDRELVERVREGCAAGRDVEVVGYLQSHMYFDRHMSIIRAMFAVDDDTMGVFTAMYPRLFDGSCTPVAVHVRQHYARTMYTTDYYQVAVELMRERVERPHFFVFSNDMDWCEANLGCLGEEVSYVRGQTDYEDLWMMALCHHHVISHSTLALWGVFLNPREDKVVFYPEDSLRIHYGKLHEHPVCVERLVEFYAPEWVGVPGRTIRPE